VGQVLARLFALIGEPPVIGEVIAGILLGPSLLGEQVSARILTPEIVEPLSAVAQIGLILYMFTVGLDLNGALLRRRMPTAVATATGSILLPFLLGAGLAIPLFAHSAGPSATPWSFSLFMGAAIAITAFPVLARILDDLGIAKTELGVLALGCAAVNDVIAWCLLAVVSGVARAESGSGLPVIAGTVLYIGVMVLLVRPAVRAAGGGDGDGEPTRAATALTLVALLLAALASGAIGIHVAFGAFLFGAIIPHDSAVARSFIAKLEAVVATLFLPAFFALTGMRTRIDLLSSADEWVICGVIVLVATIGKFAGACLAARVTGSGWRQAAALGTLLNTRGLIELIFLNVGLELKVISPTLFSMMVVMALVTTMITAPVLRLLMRGATLD